MGKCGSTGSTNKTTTPTTTPKTTTTTTKVGGTSTANQYGGGSGGGTGSTKSWGDGTSAGSTNKTNKTVAGTQTVAGGMTSGTGVLNQDVALYRVPEAWNAEAALAAAVKAAGGASTDKGKSTEKTVTTDSKNGSLAQVEASIFAAGPEYLRAATALGINPREYLDIFSGAANPTGSITPNRGVTTQAGGTVNEAGGKLSAGEVWAYGGFTGGMEDLWVMTMYGIEPEEYLAAAPAGAFTLAGVKPVAQSGNMPTVLPKWVLPDTREEEIFADKLPLPLQNAYLGFSDASVEIFNGLDRMGLLPFLGDMTERANRRIGQFGERVNARNEAKGKGAQIGGELLQGFGQAAPDTAAFLLPEVSLPKATTFVLRVSELAGISSVLFPQHYGNAYDEAKANGLSEADTRDYALRSAINGTLLDSLIALGVAQGMGAVGKVLRKVFGQAVPKSALSNGVEEGMAKEIDVGDDIGYNRGKVSDLNWDTIISKKGETRIDHVHRHSVPNSLRTTHGVFLGDPKDIVSKAWKNRGNVVPIDDGMGGKIYNIPYKNAGYESGLTNTGAKMDYVTIIVKDGTDDIITAFPSFGNYTK